MFSAEVTCVLSFGVIKKLKQFVYDMAGKMKLLKS